MRMDRVASVFTSCPGVLADATISFSSLMAFLGAALLSFVFLLSQVLTPRGDHRSSHPSKLPTFAIFQPSLSGRLLGIHLQLSTSKTLKNSEGIKEKNAERGEKLTHFIPRAVIPALESGTEFQPGHSLTHEIHSHDGPWSKSLPFLTVLMYGEFGHCEPSPSVGRATI